MTIRIALPESHVPGRRLGRNVLHDPRSWEFPAPMASALKAVEHQRLVPIFDQGDLGSCTGNAAVGCVSTSPFGLLGNEGLAIDVYSEATRIDGVAGVYPPNDTGSSGLAVMKALKKRGVIRGYGHTFALSSLLRALVRGPGILGMNWLSGCDEPDSAGVVRYEGELRGGHEVELVGLDPAKRLVKLANSWGPSWGRGGFFFLSFDDLGRVLADRGDAIFPTLP